MRLVVLEHQTMTDNIIPGLGSLDPNLDPHVWQVFEYTGGALPIGFDVSTPTPIMPKDEYGISKLYKDGPFNMKANYVIGNQDGVSNRWNVATDEQASIFPSPLTNVNYEISLYFRINASSWDSIEHKMWGPHHGSAGIPYGPEGSGSPCCWYDVGLEDNGDIDVEVEYPHPDNIPKTFPGPGPINIGSTTNRWIGLKWVIYKIPATPNHRKIELWYDSGGLDGSNQPINNWIKRMDKIDTGDWLPLAYSPPNQQELELRIRNVNPSAIQIHRLYARDIIPGELSTVITPGPPIHSFLVKDNSNRAVTTAAFVSLTDAINYRTYWTGVWEEGPPGPPPPPGPPSPPPPPPPTGPVVLEWHITGGIFGQANANPFMSLGGQMAAKVLDDKLDNLFDPVGTIEQTKGSTEYRWIVLYNAGGELFRNPHFYFLPKNPNIDIEICRLEVSTPVRILPTEEDRPTEEEIGPEVDVPMPFEKTTEAYESTLSVGPDIPAGGKLYICVRRIIPEDSPSENRAFRLVCESRIPSSESSGAFITTEEGGPEGGITRQYAPGR